MVLRYALSGPLLMVWSVGLVPFVLIFHRALFAMLWSVVMVLLGFGIAADCLRTPNIRSAIDSVVRESFGANSLMETRTRAAFDHGVCVLGEIVGKIYAIDRLRGPDPHLHDVIPSAWGLVSLLSDSATEAEELDRGLTVANQSAARGPLQTNQTPGIVALRRQTRISEIRRDANEARKAIDEITEQLETLMLRVFQLGKCPADSEASLELHREAEDMLETVARRGDTRRADRYVPASFQQSRAALERGLSEINFAEGRRALQRLVSEYAHLQALFDRARATASISLGQVRTAAEETYRLGLVLLEDVLELARVASPSEIRRVEDAVLQLEKKIELAAAAPVQDERTQLLDATMRSHLERLDVMRKQATRVEQLLQLVISCEVSLNRTRMELAALKAADSELAVKDATDGLRRTIDRAKEVQDELAKVGL